MAYSYDVLPQYHIHLSRIFIIFFSSFIQLSILLIHNIFIQMRVTFCDDMTNSNWLLTQFTLKLSSLFQLVSLTNLYLHLQEWMVEISLILWLLFIFQTLLHILDLHRVSTRQSCLFNFLTLFFYVTSQNGIAFTIFLHYDLLNVSEVVSTCLCNV